MKKIFTLAFMLFAFVALNAQVYLNESFESPTCPPTGWTIVYGDGDASVNAMTHNSSQAATGSRSFRFSSYTSTTDYTQFLITPEITATDSIWVLFKYRRYSASYPEVFEVGYSTTTTDTNAFTWSGQITDAVNSDWTLFMAKYPATVKYVAIKYESNYQYYLYIDDFMVLDRNYSTMSASAVRMSPIQVDPDSVSLSACTVSGFQWSDPITFSVAAGGPYTLSLDGTQYSNTVTMPAPTTTNFSSYVFVKFTSNTAGVFTDSIQVVSGTFSTSVPLYCEAVTCSLVTNLPFSQDFELSNFPPMCWTASAPFGSMRYTDGTRGIVFMDEDRLILPEFSVTDPMQISFNYETYTGSLGSATKFHVGYSSTTMDSITWFPEVTVSDNATYTCSQLVPAGTKYIAIEVTEMGYYSYYDNYLIIDNVLVEALTNSVLSVSPDTLVFAAMDVNNMAVQSVVVSAANLTSDISVTAPANFEVSSDNTTFASSLTTFPSVGGTLYVRYNPAAVGTHSGTINLTSGSMTASVAVFGEAISCGVTQFPYMEDFNETSNTRNCWEIVDANGDADDGYGEFNLLAFDTVNTGSMVYFYSSDNAANDWLISPEITLDATPRYATFEYVTPGTYGPEAYAVYVIPQGSTYANAVNVVPTQTVSNTAWQTQEVNLSAYANQTIRVAIKAASEADKYWIAFDNFQVTTIPTSLAVNPASLSFSTDAGNPDMKTVTVSSSMLTAPIAVSTAAPFEVSLDGATYAATASIPVTGNMSDDILYVRFNPSASTVGTFNGTVTLTSGSETATITLTALSVDCSDPKTLPFVEDFEDELDACWQIIDNDGDGFVWTQSFSPNITANSGNGCFYSESYHNATHAALTPDNWLITPLIAIPAEGAKLSWFVAAQDPDYPAEHYEVLVSTTWADLSTYVTVFDETLSSDEWEERSVNLGSEWAGKIVTIAFRHTDVTDKFEMKLDDITITPGVGVESRESVATIYPNPANNVLNINANSNISMVEVFNVTGQVVASYNANDVNTQINTSNFANGVYTVRIHTENGVSNQKFTVAR